MMHPLYLEDGEQDRGDDNNLNVNYSRVGVANIQSEILHLHDVRNDADVTHRRVSHNVSRMLSEEVSRVKPLSTAHFLSFRYRSSPELSEDRDRHEERYAGNNTELPNLESDHERQSCVTPIQSDTSLSSISPSSSTTSGTGTPPSRSGSSSPDSGCGSGTSPGSDSEPVKKNARTNYTPEQIKTLEKIFFETPYPDSEHMETISKDLGVPENKIKIWFQNKRARWRRRVNATGSTTSRHQLTVPTMPSLMPQFNPYSYMTYPSPMRISQYLPGYHPGTITAPNNHRASGLGSPSTHEPVYNPPQWQYYQRNHPGYIQQSHPVASPPQHISSHNEPMMSSSHRPFPSNSYLGFNS